MSDCVAVYCLCGADYVSGDEEKTVVDAYYVDDGYCECVGLLGVRYQQQSKYQYGIGLSDYDVYYLLGSSDRVYGDAGEYLN
ncbi:MAG: hypothetical protein EZS28_004448 [Streblomastix strix]|uniref:Uncharacterized protein n=1 Tax=Streblomastix strix TaxID=222440 RepID=A0A5J4WY55_9EUKA|nr:MAG: hypothetical protein EZS28_004448 [Streblomastix strix]